MKKAEEALRESESLMAGLLNGIPLSTFMPDLNGTIDYESQPDKGTSATI